MANPKGGQIFKIVLLGVGAVGKTALCIRYTNDKFVKNYDPTIEDCYRLVSEVDKELYHIEIIDTAGTEQFSAMREVYLKNADGFLLIFSLINRNSLSELEDVWSQIVRVKDNPKFPMTLVANKCDLSENEWEIEKREIEEFAAAKNISFYYTSAKTGQVKVPFECVIRQIARQPAASERKRIFGCTLL